MPVLEHPKMIDIKHYATKAHEAAKAKGWWDEPSSMPTLKALIISELCKALKSNSQWRSHVKFHIETKPSEWEVWKPIDGYVGEYQVSNLGRIRSLNIQVWNGKVNYTKKGRILKPGLSGTGYYTVSLRGKTHKVSRLVAIAFCSGYKDGLVVNHINGNKKEDYANNLEWISYGSNNLHASKTGLRITPSVLTKKDKINIALRRERGELAKEIVKDYPSVTISAIKNISRNREKILDITEQHLADAAIRILDVLGWNKKKLGSYKGTFVMSDEALAFFTFSENIYEIIKEVVQSSPRDNYFLLIPLRYIEALAEQLNIDLIWHIEAKLRYNELRPRKHGKSY